MLRHLGVLQKPLIVALKLKNDNSKEHLVVIHKCKLKVGTDIIDCSYFDPIDKVEKTMSWKKCKQRITACWYVSVANQQDMTF